MNQSCIALSSSPDRDCTPVPVTQEHKLPKVLIVEDDLAFAYLCTSFLESADEKRYVAVETNTISDALAVLQKEDISCVLVDYRLPDGTGVELIEKLYQTIPDWLGSVILMTAMGNEEIVVDGMRAGAEDYIAKHNLSAQSLYKLLDRVFEKVSLKRKLRIQNVELSQAYSQLQRRTTEITEFYHKVSHEVKTPLTAAMMFLSILKDGLVGDLNEEQSELVLQALESCAELTKHFDDLIDCTRLEARKVRLTYTEENLGRLVTRSVASLLSLGEEKKITLKVDVSSDLPLVCVDAGRIVQVLANLAGNALKFTEANGTVNIKARRSPSSEKFIEISVADTGIGIRAENLPNIFERLYQVDSEGNPQTGAGLGLGLSIVKEIIELHGGSIDVSSNYGTGTVFTVQIPIGPIKSSSPTKSDSIGESPS